MMCKISPRISIPLCFSTGHKILNTVDCTRPNGGRLPEKVALMMSDFAGGASGFPMTFSGGKFTGNILYQSNAKERCGALLNAVRIKTKIIKIQYLPTGSLTGKQDSQTTDR